ncbi:MAG: hypothetical protein ACYC5O_08780 [Anaerolineae bacterium]
MVMPLIVVAVLAAVVGLALISQPLGVGLVIVSCLAGILARMAQAKAYQTEHMDTLRIQSDALQKLLGKVDVTGALTGAAASSRRVPPNQ